MHTILYLPVTHCNKTKTTIIKARKLLKDPKFYPCCPFSLSHYEKKHSSSKHWKFEVKPSIKYFWIPYANKHDLLITKMKAYTNFKEQ